MSGNFIASRMSGEIQTNSKQCEWKWQIRLNFSLMSLITLVYLPSQRNVLCALHVAHIVISVVLV